MHGIAWNHMVPCMESRGIIWFQAWNRIESYGSRHGIVWNHMVPGMESHGIIWFHAWNRMESYGSKLGIAWNCRYEIGLNHMENEGTHCNDI